MERIGSRRRDGWPESMMCSVLKMHQKPARLQPVHIFRTTRRPHPVTSYAQESMLVGILPLDTATVSVGSAWLRCQHSPLFIGLARARISGCSDTSSQGLAIALDLASDGIEGSEFPTGLPARHRRRCLHQIGR